MVYSHNESYQDTLFLFLEDVVGVDLSKYEFSQRGNSSYSDGKGISMAYHLVYNEDILEIVFDFWNGKVTYFYASLSGITPMLLEPVSNTLDAAKTFLSKYRDFSRLNYFDTMINMLNSVNELEDCTVEQGNVTQRLTIDEWNNTRITWVEAVNGLSLSQNAITLSFNKNGILNGFSDHWKYYLLGSAEVNVSKEEAIALALERVENFSYQIGDTTVSNLQPLRVVTLYPKLSMWPKDGMLFPYWEMYVPLDHTYLGFISSVHVIIRADTGEISTIQASKQFGSTTPPEDIPEFPSWTILPIFIVSSLAIIVLRRKFQRKKLE